MRTAILTAVLSVTLGSITMVASAAAEDDCGEVKQKALKKHWNNQGQCSAECLEGSITRMLSAGAMVSAARASLRLHLVATDAGRHHLLVRSSVLVGRYRGEKRFAVRAREDPLVLMFEGGGETQLYPACDLSSTTGSDKRVQKVCGFYNVSRAQIEELSGKKLSEIKLFFLAPKDEHFENPRLEHTKDGRSYFDFTWTAERDKPVELMRQAQCMLRSK